MPSWLDFITDSLKKRKLASISLASLFAVVLLYLWSAFNLGSFLIVKQLDRPISAIALILALSFATWMVGVRDGLIGIAGGILIGFASVGRLALIGFVDFPPRVEIDSKPAPREELEARIVTYRNDLKTEVYVRKHAGLLTREWKIACFIRDSGESVTPPIGVRWKNNHHLQVSNDFATEIDPRTGRSAHTRACDF